MAKTGSQITKTARMKIIRLHIMTIGNKEKETVSYS